MSKTDKWLTLICDAFKNGLLKLMIGLAIAVATYQAYVALSNYFINLVLKG